MRTGSLSVHFLGHSSQGNGRSHQAGAAACGIFKLNCGCSLAHEAERKCKHHAFPVVQCAADLLQSTTVTCWDSSSSGPVLTQRCMWRCGSTCCVTAVQDLSVGKRKRCSASAETRTNREATESRGRSCLHAGGPRRTRSTTGVICRRVFGEVAGTGWMRLMSNLVTEWCKQPAVPWGSRALSPTKQRQRKLNLGRTRGMSYFMMKLLSGWESCRLEWCMGYSSPLYLLQIHGWWVAVLLSKYLLVHFGDNSNA